MAERCSGRTSPCCTPAASSAWARRSARAQTAASTSDRAIRVRGGRWAGWMSASSSCREQWTTIGSGGLVSRTARPDGRITNIGSSSSLNPLSPPSRAAVSPPSAEPGPAHKDATQSRCLSVSGPDWATISPRHGCCQRPDAIRQRSSWGDRCASAEPVVSTPSCSASRSPRADGNGNAVIIRTSGPAARHRYSVFCPVDNAFGYPQRGGLSFAVSRRAW